MPRFSSLATLFKASVCWLAMLLILAPVGVQAADKSLFWKVESPTGITSYLFGTMHTDDNRVTDFSPQVLEALKSADTFMMEVSPSQDPKLLMLPEGNIATLMTNEEFEQVRELADFHVMHLGAAMQMKPWLLAVIFDLPKPQTPFAQDNLLMTTSQDLSKDVVGIETPQEHFGVMDSFSLDEQMVMLRAVLKRSPEQKEKDFERLMSAYLKGDAEKIASLDEQITGDMLPKPLWQKMRAKLLDERNVVMAQRSLAKASVGPTFVAVGASHLAGPTGLISTFKQAGFTLTPLKMR
jgi:uncharacterized protein YbaP (TraB family)